MRVAVTRAPSTSRAWERPLNCEGEIGTSGGARARKAAATPSAALAVRKARPPPHPTGIAAASPSAASPWSTASGGET